MPSARLRIAPKDNVTMGIIVQITFCARSGIMSVTETMQKHKNGEAIRASEDRT